MQNNPILREMLWAGVDGVCKNKSCGRSITTGTNFFYDPLNDSDYCQQCGVMLRYHRKKALERGETVPLNFEKIEEN
jgi:hypothetical protein